MSRVNTSSLRFIALAKGLGNIQRMDGLARSTQYTLADLCIALAELITFGRVSVPTVEKSDLKKLADRYMIEDTSYWLSFDQDARNLSSDGKKVENKFILGLRAD